MINQAADVTSHQAMLDGKPHTHAIEPNDRLGASPPKEVQLKVEQEGRKGETGATEHEQALNYIPNKHLPRRAIAPTWRSTNLLYWRMHGYSNMILCCPSVCRKLITALSRCFGVVPLPCEP